MNADADMQVWLETVGNTQPRVVVPYVQSAVNRPLRYQVLTVSDGPQGRTVISQGSTIMLAADQPTSLGTLSVRQTPDSQCNITITIYTNHKQASDGNEKHEFLCPNL